MRTQQLIGSRTLSAIGKSLSVLMVAAAGTALVLQSSAVAGSPVRSNWTRHPANPVLLPGFEARPGGPIGSNVADPSVLYDEDDRRWKMWFATTRQEGALPRVLIKYAESADGVQWNVQPEPALDMPASPEAWDATQVEAPTVVKNLAASASRRFQLWYSGGNSRARRLATHYPWLQIGLAFSEDGRHFVRLSAEESSSGQAGLVWTAKNAFPGDSSIVDGVLSDPEVLLHEGVYHLWCSAIGMDANGLVGTTGITHATSSDGIHWASSSQNPLPGLTGHAPGGGTQPSVLWNPGQRRFEMWFTSDHEKETRQMPAKGDAALGYWMATSSDGERWTQLSPRDFLWDPQYGGEMYGLATGAEVVLVDSEYRIYYGAFGRIGVLPNADPPMAWALNLATHPAE